MSWVVQQARRLCVCWWVRDERSDGKGKVGTTMARNRCLSLPPSPCNCRVRGSAHIHDTPSLTLTQFIMADTTVPSCALPAALQTLPASIQGSHDEVALTTSSIPISSACQPWSKGSQRIQACRSL